MSSRNLVSSDSGRDGSSFLGFRFHETAHWAHQIISTWTVGEYLVENLINEITTDIHQLKNIAKS
jgi:hypothetical protein